MTRYLDKTFSVGGTSRRYRDNYDVVFRGAAPTQSASAPAPLPSCGNELVGYKCQLVRGHKGAHQQMISHEPPMCFVNWINGMVL